jgi:hypothetical protein
VGLTAEVELSLRDTGLVDYFDRHQKPFTEMFEASRAYVAGYVETVQLPVRRDDVANRLVPALMTHEGLREFMAERKLRQLYWFQRFADLIYDRLWDDADSASSG